ncbi:MAG: hypothetical protein GY861_28330 [bacterium]|nr:hypothetical protein [bacterium]
MGTILASKIIADAAEAMLDEGYERYATADWLGFLNDGQNELVILKPDASVINQSVVQIAGTKQTLGAEDISLIKLTKNMGTDGTTPGTIIELVDERQFGIQNPDWNTTTADAEVICYMFDDRDPKNYYVYPPQPTSSQGYVEIVTCVKPTDIASISSAINLDDIYEGALLNYILYRANLVNANQSQFAQSEATKFYNVFSTSLGRQDLVEKTIDPKSKGTEYGKS